MLKKIMIFSNSDHIEIVSSLIKIFQIIHNGDNLSDHHPVSVCMDLNTRGNLFHSLGAYAWKDLPLYSAVWLLGTIKSELSS